MGDPAHRVRTTANTDRTAFPASAGLPLRTCEWVKKGELLCLIGDSGPAPAPAATTEPVSVYRAGLTTIGVWLRINPEFGDHFIGFCPFWAQRPPQSGSGRACVGCPS